MSSRQAEPAVFFDIDGTLLDTNYLHTLAWSRALAEAGVPATMAQIHRLIGRDGDDLLTEIAGRTNDQIGDAHTRYFAELSDEIRPLPGAVELVKEVHCRGLRVVIVTSAGKAELRLLLGALGCEDEIDSVVHGDDVSSAKPAPDIYRHALEETGGDPKQTVALGDTAWDIEAARGAGLGCVAVETGGIARCDLEDSGAVAIYRSCAEIVANYDESPFGALGTAHLTAKRL